MGGGRWEVAREAAGEVAGAGAGGATFHHGGGGGGGAPRVAISACALRLHRCSRTSCVLREAWLGLGVGVGVGLGLGLGVEVRLGLGLGSGLRLGVGLDVLREALFES